MPRAAALLSNLYVRLHMFCLHSKLLVSGLCSCVCVGEAGTKWQFPQAEHQEGETMRQTAERALQETIQEGPQTYFVGNLPIGHVADSGYKAFFHKAQLIKGEAALKQDGKAYDFAWVAKDELPEYIVDEPHQELMSKVLGS